MTRRVIIIEDDMVVASIAEYLRESHAAARPGAFRVIVERLSDRYGAKLVDKALHEYEKAMGQERRWLKRENRRLERERQWLKRQTT